MMAFLSCGEKMLLRVVKNIFTNIFKCQTSRLQSESFAFSKKKNASRSIQNLQYHVLIPSQSSQGLSPNPEP